MKGPNTAITITTLFCLHEVEGTNQLADLFSASTQEHVSVSPESGLFHSYREIPKMHDKTILHTSCFIFKAPFKTSTTRTDHGISYL